MTQEAPYAVQQPPLGNTRRAAFRAALNAGTVGAILSAVPIAGLFVVALPLAGFLCVLLYRRFSRIEEPTPGVGFRLGAGTGLASFVILMTLYALQILGLHAEDKVREALIQSLQQMQTRYSDPQTRQALEHLMTPEGLVFLMVIGSAFMCILFVILSGLGGAISAALLRRKSPPQ